MVTLKVDVTYNANSYISSNVALSYFQIIPTGLAVFGIENGVSSVLIGSNQEFNLQPSIYSIDLDNLVTPDKLSFTYYCQTVNISSASSAISPQADLKTYSNDPNLVMMRSRTCFGNNSKIKLYLYFLILTVYKEFLNEKKSKIKKIRSFYLIYEKRFFIFELLNRSNIFLFFWNQHA